MSPAERYFSTSMYAKVGTGGNCSALQRNIEGHGLFILVTNQYDAMAPESLNAPVRAGLYAEGADHAEPLAIINAPDCRSLLRKIHRGEWEPA